MKRIIVAMAFLASSLSGCAMFQRAVVPVIDDVVMVAQDALAILNAIRAAEAVFFLANPDPRAQAEVENAIGDANLALDAALQTASGTKSLSASDANAGFDAFRQAYGDLVTLVAQLGIVRADPKGRLAVRRGAEVSWAEPIAMRRRVGE